MKAEREHRIPLSDESLALLKALPRMAGTDLVFPNAKNTALSDMTLTAVLRRMNVAVALGAVLRNDDREIQSIGEVIGKKDRITRSEMARGNLRLLVIILSWELDFWRTAQKYSSLLVLIAAGEYIKEGAKKVMVVEIICQVLQSNLASMLEAMRLWCEEIGLDFNVVAATEISDFPMSDEFMAGPKQVSEVLAVLRRATRN